MRTRRNIVQSLIESPFYWDLSVRERLALVRQLEFRTEPSVQQFRLAVCAWLIEKGGNYGRIVHL